MIHGTWRQKVGQAVRLGCRVRVLVPFMSFKDPTTAYSNEAHDLIAFKRHISGGLSQVLKARTC